MFATNIAIAAASPVSGFVASATPMPVIIGAIISDFQSPLPEFEL